MQFLQYSRASRRIRLCSRLATYCLQALLLVGLVAPMSMNALADDDTYEPTKGFDLAKAALARVTHDGNKLSADTRKVLLVEGQAILKTEQMYLDGKAPIQQKHRKLTEKAQYLKSLPNTTEEQISNHYEEFEKLTKLIQEDNQRLELRYASFVRSVDAAFSIPNQHRIKDSSVAIKNASKKHRGDTCNLFVGSIGAELNIPYLRDIEHNNTGHDAKQANNIYRFLEKAIQTETSSGWREVSDLEAQILADHGKLVLGVARNVNPTPTNHGHICIVAPSSDGELPHSRVEGHGPWVRDAQNPHLSVRASKRFGKTVVTPLFVVWEGGQ